MSPKVIIALPLAGPFLQIVEAKNQIAGTKAFAFYSSHPVVANLDKMVFVQMSKLLIPKFEFIKCMKSSKKIFE